MNAIREFLFWRLLALADKATDVAFFSRNRSVRRTMVAVANSIDWVASVVMTSEMRNRPAEVAK